MGLALSTCGWLFFVHVNIIGHLRKGRQVGYRNYWQEEILGACGPNRRSVCLRYSQAHQALSREGYFHLCERSSPPNCGVDVVNLWGAPGQGWLPLHHLLGGKYLWLPIKSCSCCEKQLSDQIKCLIHLLRTAELVKFYRVPLCSESRNALRLVHAYSKRDLSKDSL